MSVSIINVTPSVFLISISFKIFKILSDALLIIIIFSSSKRDFEIIPLKISPGYLEFLFHRM